MAVEILYEVAVCTDCYMAAAGVLEPDAETEYAPLTQIYTGDTPPIVLAPGDSLGFSNWPCGGCESPLAGDRHQLTVMTA